MLPDVTPPALGQREVQCAADVKHLTLHVLSDIHVGADRYQQQHVEAFLKWIARRGPEHRLIFGGDWADVRNKDGKSFKHGRVMSPDDEADYLEKLWRPVRDRVDLVIDGNHEDRTFKIVGFNFTQKVVKAIGGDIIDAYRPGPTVLRHRFVRHKQYKGPYKAHYFAEVRGLVHHGFGGGRSMGAPINNLERIANWIPDVDYCTMGHVHHNHIGFRTLYLGWPLRKHTQLMCISGTGVDHETYAQYSGFQPSTVCHIAIHARRDWNPKVDHTPGVVAVTGRIIRTQSDLAAFD